MTLSDALVELTTYKRILGFYDGLIKAATNATNEYHYGEQRTKDTVTRVLYPGIDINTLREEKNVIESKVKKLQKDIKKKNWEIDQIERLDLRDEMNDKITELISQIHENIRVYSDEVDNVVDVSKLIDEVNRLLVEVEFVTKDLQRKNVETQL